MIIKKRPHFLTAEEEIVVCKLYQEGNTLKVLGEQFNVNFGTIQHVLKRKGISRRSPQITSRKYTWKQDFFDNIITEGQAYWLGFLLAEGSVVHDKTRLYLQVGLAERDETHLHKLARDLGDERAVHTYHQFGTTRLVVYSSQIAISLLREGIRNSQPRQFPTGVPGQLLHHVCRGYFDGDGSISAGILASGKTYQHVTFQTNDVSILERINELVSDKCGLTLKKFCYYARKPAAPILTWTGYQETLKIRDYFYKGASIYLERKKAMFERLLL